ncbi:MAG: WD40/YVTN/BNR-like repeat-containing protein, partial [Methanococcaceae archaeon]
MKKYLLLLFLQVLFNKNDFIQAQWVQTNGPGGARVLSFAIRDNNIFAGTYGGIHLSTDNGLTWNAINNGLPENTSFISMAIKDNIVWAGTYGKGIFLSTNGGLNWSSANDGLPVEYAWINGLVFSRDTVFAGIYTGNYGEVYISTDYGESWGSVSNGLPKFNNLKALSISRNRLVAAISKGIYLSVDNGLH